LPSSAQIQREQWPRISIVVPSYNYGTYLSRALDSILCQNYPNTQIILIDGASSDSTPAVLAAYRDRLNVCICEPDQGQTDALNKGYRYVDGDLFNWLNADDALAPGSLQAIANAWRQGHDLIIGQCRMVYEQEGKSDLPRIYAPRYASYFDFQATSWRGFLYQPAVFISTSIANACFPLDPDLRQVMDYQYHLRALRQRPRTCLLQQQLCTFYYHGANMSSSDTPKVPEIERVLRQELRFHPARQQRHLQRVLEAGLQLHAWISSPQRPTVAAILRAMAANPTLVARSLSWRMLARSVLVHWLGRGR
jgi:hypothetical protein